MKDRDVCVVGQRTHGTLKRKRICWEGAGGTRVPMDVDMVKTRTTESSYFIKRCHNGSDTFYAAFFFFKSVSHYNALGTYNMKTAAHWTIRGLHGHHLTEVRMNIWGVTSHCEAKVLVSMFMGAEGSHSFPFQRRVSRFTSSWQWGVFPEKDP